MLLNTSSMSTKSIIAEKFFCCSHQENSSTNMIHHLLHSRNLRFTDKKSQHRLLQLHDYSNTFYPTKSLAEISLFKQMRRNQLLWLLTSIVMLSFVEAASSQEAQRGSKTRKTALGRKSIDNQISLSYIVHNPVVSHNEVKRKGDLILNFLKVLFEKISWVKNQMFLESAPSFTKVRFCCPIGVYNTRTISQMRK